MNWRVKARIQNLVGALPVGIAYSVYYALQRRFGALGRVNSTKHFENAVRLAAALRRVGVGLAGASVFELGTGRTVNCCPVALWLAGAGRITTVDLNPYLRADLCDESIAWLRAHPIEVDAAFGPLEPGREFRERLSRIAAQAPGIGPLLELCGIEYLVPLDATRSGLPNGLFDIYLSTNVIEHVPPDVVKGLFREARRILKPGGVMVHYINLRDHFYTTDLSITMVNFLQFSAWRMTK